MKKLILSILMLSEILAFSQSPGNVSSNLTLWLKADAGITGSPAVTAWSDMSGNGNNATQSLGAATLTPNAMNFNNALTFSGSEGYNTASFASNQTFAVVKLTGGGNTFYQIFGKEDNSGGERTLGVRNNVVQATGAFWNYPSAAGDVRVEGASSTAFSVSTDHLLTANAGTGGSVTYNFDIGESASGSGWSNFQGEIAEIISYSSAKTGTDLQKVESYLAIKYGITLDNLASGTNGDYLSSWSTTIWDASANSTYHNDVVGIGRDDNSDIYQKQSKTNDDSLIVYIDALAANNSSNTGTITNDESFLLIGHNGDALQSQITELPSGIYSRLSREWKVTNTSFTDNYSFDVEWDSIGVFDINEIRLLVDTDGEFSNANVYSSADGLTFSNGSIIISGINTTHIPANTTSYFTIGSVSSLTPLPIELFNFSAKPMDNSLVKLNWQTASEINNDYFTIERSTNVMDWEVLNNIDGAGNSSILLSYFSIDKFPHFGISYYRLKQTDFDGQFSYSNIVAVDIESSNSISIYPIQTNDIITITGNESDLKEIIVLNSLGQNVTQLIKVEQLNKRSVIVNLTNLSKGLYFIKTKTTTNKVYKQ